MPTYEGRNHPREQVIEQISCIYYRSRIVQRVLTNMKFILLQSPHVHCWYSSCQNQKTHVVGL